MLKNFKHLNLFFRHSLVLGLILNSPWLAASSSSASSITSIFYTLKIPTKIVTTTFKVMTATTESAKDQVVLAKEDARDYLDSGQKSLLLQETFDMLRQLGEKLDLQGVSELNDEDLALEIVLF